MAATRYQELRTSEQSIPTHLLYTTIPSVSNVLQFYCSLNKILLSLVLHESIVKREIQPIKLSNEHSLCFRINIMI